MSKEKYNVGGRKQAKANAKTLAGRIVAWARKRKHPVDTELKSHPVMFSVQNETATVSKKTGKHRIMFTVFGADADNCKIWLNAYSRRRGSKEKATANLLPKANWGKVDSNVNAGATFTPNDGATPTDTDLDYMFDQCAANVPEKKARKTKKSKKDKKAKAIKGTAKGKKAKKTKQHVKIKKAA